MARFHSHPFKFAAFFFISIESMRRVPNTFIQTTVDGRIFYQPKNAFGVGGRYSRLFNFFSP